MSDDEPNEPVPADRGISRNFWHLVATAYVGALIYAQVWQQLDVPFALYLVAALVGEPGAFVKLASAQGGELLKWLKAPRS